MESKSHKGAYWVITSIRLYTNLIQEAYLLKKMSKGVMIGVIVIILILGILVLVAAFGFLRGFYPVEHNRIIKNAERYVVDTYGLTPTEVRITTLYLWFPVTLLIETEEDNFSFILRTGRFRYGVRHFIDNYPESMAEYFLIKDLRIYVENATDGQGRVWGSVTGGFILPKLRDIPDIKENISIAIEELHGSYYLGISMNEDTIRSIDDVNIDLMYSIYSHIFELDLHPSRVTFGFRSTNEKNDRTFFHANIRKNDFGNIKLPEDLKPFVEEAIEFYNVVISQLEN